MTVTSKDAPIGGWKAGWTWLLGLAMNGFDPAPAYEVLWTETGEPVHTGRRALVTKTNIDNSQKVDTNPAPYEPQEALGERLLDPEEYREMIRLTSPPASRMKHAP